MNVIKKFFHHLFVDGLNGMACGFFATFVFGSILQQIGTYCGGTLGSLFLSLGKLTAAGTCAGIGIGVACKLKENLWITLSAAVCGMAGGYYSQIAAGTLLTNPSSLFSTTGEPLAAFIAAYAGIFFGHLIAGKTRFDLLLTPVITIGTRASIGILAGPVVSTFISWFESLIHWGTTLSPFFMGIVVSVLMGLAATLPIHAATLACNLNLTGLAAGAATVGCCCHMIGFAVASYKDNKASGLISQGLGTSTLQISNVLCKPWILLPVILSSAIMGAVSTVLLPITNTTAGAGTGTMGFACSLTTLRLLSQTEDPALAMIKILLMHFILPGLLTYIFSEWMRKHNWIKQGDMRLDL